MSTDKSIPDVGADDGADGGADGGADDGADLGLGIESGGIGIKVGLCRFFFFFVFHFQKYIILLLSIRISYISCLYHVCSCTSCIVCIDIMYNGPTVAPTKNKNKGSQKKYKKNF